MRSYEIPADPPGEATRLARDALEVAATHQRAEADPAHEQFYDHAREIVAALHALDALAGVLAGQVSRYGDRRILRDDDGADPAGRLEAAGGHLGALREALNAAAGHAERYWSEIGHIAVEVDPDGED